MYGFNVHFKGDFKRAVETVTQALKAEGFGIISQIDVQATLKEKLGVEEKPYLILGACNPSFAHQAIQAEPDIGLLLPCNVVVREEKAGGIVVGFMDPQPVLGLVNSDKVNQIGMQVRERLQRVAQAIS